MGKPRHEPFKPGEEAREMGRRAGIKSGAVVTVDGGNIHTGRGERQFENVEQLREEVRRNAEQTLEYFEKSV